jgi:putative transposase
MGRQGYSAEFRRKVLDLLAAGRSVASVAHDLDISDQTIYNWRRQDRVDRGESPGLSSAEMGELATANKRIRELETELALARRAVDLLKEETSPKSRYAAVEVIAAEDQSVQVACRVLGVSEAGFYEHRNRKPSERDVRHAMLTDVISQIHLKSRGTYGARRVHAELTLGRGVVVAMARVELLMRRAGMQGISGRRKWKRIRADDISTDLVKRNFGRQGPNQLWVTDITEQLTREGRSAAARSWIPFPGESSAGRSIPRPRRRW